MASMDWQNLFQSGYDPKVGVTPNALPAPQPQAAPEDAGNPLDALIQKLLAGQGGAQGGGLAQRIGPLNVPFQPLGTNPSGGQLFLRGLVSGFNGRAGEKGSGSLKNVLALMQERSRIRANDALAGQRDARASQIASPQGAPAKVDPYEADKHAWWKARAGAAEASGRAADALASRRGRPDAPRLGRSGGGGSRSGRGGAGDKTLTMAQKRAQINSLAQAEKQRVANNIKAKYRDVYDYNNPTSGTPEGKRTVDAAIARGIAQVEQEHARVLRDLGAQYGMDQGENAPVTSGAVDPNSAEGIAAAMRAHRGK